ASKSSSSASPSPASTSTGSIMGYILAPVGDGCVNSALGVLVMQVEAVPDVADGADDLLGIAELGAQAPHVHVDRAGAAEVVVPPHVAEQLLAGEHPGRVRGEEVQELELLVGQVQGAA